MAAPGTDLERRGFDEVDSVLLKLNEELGLSPQDVLGIYLLGLGETRFPTCMEYVYRGRDEQGQEYSFEVPVRMPTPQNTVNKNFVVEVSPSAPMNLRSLTSASWIDREGYLDNRDQFCAYEQQFVDALFGIDGRE